MKIFFATLLLAGLLLAMPVHALTLNYTDPCFASEPNVDTGDVTSGKGMAGYSNLTDRDLSTAVAATGANATVIDLLTPYTINDFRVYVNSGSSTDMFVYGSPDNATGWVLITQIGTVATGWNNITTTDSMRPRKNIRFIRIGWNTGGPKINETDVRGYPEQCIKDSVDFWGTPAAYSVVYHEISLNNSNNNNLLIYQDQLGFGQRFEVANTLSAAGGNSYPVGGRAFGVLHELVNGQGYAVADTTLTSSSTPKPFSIYKFDTNTRTSTLWTTIAGASGMASIARNASFLYVGTGGNCALANNKVCFKSYTIRISNALLINTSGFNSSRASNDLMGGAYLEPEPTGTADRFRFYTTNGATVYYMSYISTIGLFQNTSWSPTAVSATGAVPYFNGTSLQLLVGSDSGDEIYTTPADGSGTAQQITPVAVTYEYNFTSQYSGYGNSTSQGVTNGFLLYLNDTPSPPSKTLHTDVFCASSASPVLGTPCACPAGYAFNGVTCFYVGGDGANASFDKVELRVRDYCEEDRTVGYHMTCANYNLFNGITDHVQLRYLINGVDAYTLTNGSAYCVGTAYSVNFTFPWNTDVIGENGQHYAAFEKDVNRELGTENASVYCPWYSAGNQDANICLRDSFIQVSCYANSSQYTGDDIETVYFVKGTRQDISAITTKIGTGGAFPESIPVGSQSFDVETSITHGERLGRYACGVGFDAVGVNDQGGIKQMYADLSNPLVDKYTRTLSHYEGDNFTLRVGDNRLTQDCRAYCYDAHCDTCLFGLCVNCLGTSCYPLESRISYEKFTAWNDCTINNGTAWIQDGYFYTTNGNGTFHLNYSYNNTQFTTNDDPWFRFSYWVYDANGQNKQTDAVCGYVVTNASNGAQIKSGATTVTADEYYTQVRGPLDGPVGRKVWPQSGNADGKTNYTITFQCNSNMCRNIAYYSVNFTVVDSACTGQSDSCRPVDPSNISLGCVNCHDTTVPYTCDDGTIVQSNAYECQYAQCIPQIGLCKACSDSGHLNVGVTGSVDKANYGLVDPQIKYRTVFWNGTRSNIIRTSPLNPTCKLFLVSNGGGVLQGCGQFSLAQGIQGFDPMLCGLEYSMHYDIDSDSMVWESPSDIRLNPNQGHTIYAACTGDFAANSACTFRQADPVTFMVGDATKCPNSAVNISDGGFTDSNTCFPNSQYVCRPLENPPVYPDILSCECPKGQTKNASVLGGCQGNKDIDVGAYASPLNLFLFILLAPVVLLLVSAYWRRTGGNGGNLPHV